MIFCHIFILCFTIWYFATMLSIAIVYDILSNYHTLQRYMIFCHNAIPCYCYCIWYFFTLLSLAILYDILPQSYSLLLYMIFCHNIIHCYSMWYFGTLLYLALLYDISPQCYPLLLYMIFCHNIIHFYTVWYLAPCTQYPSYFCLSCPVWTFPIICQSTIHCNNHHQHILKLGYITSPGIQVYTGAGMGIRLSIRKKIPYGEFHFC